MWGGGPVEDALFAVLGWCAGRGLGVVKGHYPGEAAGVWWVEKVAVASFFGRRRAAATVLGGFC